MPPGESPVGRNFSQVKARNQALNWLCLCYPAMPPAFLCGIEVCTGHKAAMLGLVAFYLLLLSSVARCARHTGPARWAFGLALLATVFHIAAAISMINGRTHGVEDRLIAPIFGVAVLVGLGGAHLALHQGSKLLSVGLFATVGVILMGGLGYHAPLDDPRYFLVGFFGQALLLWKCRQHEALPAEGTGFIQSQT